MKLEIRTGLRRNAESGMNFSQLSAAGGDQRYALP
jgi:hypothetical protein